MTAMTTYRRGNCSACSQSVSVRKDGLLRRHQVDDMLCPGSETAPGPWQFEPVRSMDLVKGDLVAMHQIDTGRWLPVYEEGRQLDTADLVQIGSVADLRGVARFSGFQPPHPNARVMIHSDLVMLNLAASQVCYRVLGGAAITEPHKVKGGRKSGYYTRLYGRGVCKECGLDYTLRADGTMRRHHFYQSDPTGTYILMCPGSEAAPAK